MIEAGTPEGGTEVANLRACIGNGKYSDLDQMNIEFRGAMKDVV